MSKYAKVYLSDETLAILKRMREAYDGVLREPRKKATLR